MANKSFGTKAITMTMAILFLTGIFLAAIPIGANGTNGEGVYNIEIDGDKVVYDAANEMYWYPHLNDIIRMKKTKQGGYLDKLNAEAYGKITDWRWAVMEDLVALMWSMTYYAEIPPNPADNPPWRAYNFDPENEPIDFFPAMNEFDWIGSHFYVPCGRPADEYGVKIEIRGIDPADYLDTHPGSSLDPDYPTNPDQLLTGYTPPEGAPMDGEYHFAYSISATGSTLQFDNDHNWGRDDKKTVHPVFGTLSKWECSAWFVSETGPRKILIKPDDYTNTINLKSKGVVPVAVLTTDHFDVSTLTTTPFDASNVDPETVEFAGAYPLRWTMEDVDRDGDMDLLLFFKTQELDLTEASTEATLTAVTFSGEPFEGTDTVNIVHGS